MKIGILTQPLVNNYGGLLQAWALQQVLSRMGHQVIIIDRHSVRRTDLSWPRRIASVLKTELYILLGKEKRRVKLSEQGTNYVRKSIIKFIEGRYLGISPIIYTEKALRRYINDKNFDAFVVGSDQVWRPCYSPSIGNYYLDFLPASSESKRIAYAASFGVDFWEYSKKQTKKYSKLAQKFNLLTVRESSGIKLVKEHLKCDALHVLDPTMLLESVDYLNLIKDPTVPLQESAGKLFCYVLDQSTEIKDAIKFAEGETGLKAFYCNASRKTITQDDIKHLEQCVFPPVEQWIKSFQDAEMIVTDSFHGCVFSIIFNKPFWVVQNNNRGTARFSSLLQIFGLENRIVSTHKEIDWKTPIDWTVINSIRHQNAIFAKQLLSKALR